MAARKTGLGRGLDALLGDVKPAEQPAAGAKDGLQQIPVDLLQRGAYQPRQQFGKEALQELADSIRSQGMVQPIVVRPLTGGENRFEIVAGERRWRAAQLAGLDTVPAVVREIPDSAAIAVALIENIQREDLNPLEEARGIRRLIEEFELTHQQAAEAIGRSRTAVSNILRLLDLGPEARTLLEAGELEMGHARALLGLVSSREQAEAAAEVARRGLSVRETEQLVRRRIEGRTRPAPRTLDPDVRRLQDDLAERLGAKVAIQHSAAGKGRLVIAYNNLEELDGILEHIR